MTKLLLIEASPRGQHSVSRNMARRFVRDWLAAHPDGEVIERDLMDAGLQFVSAAWLQAYFTPAQQHSPEMANELQLSNELVAELLAADHIVIATPVYNYNVPAVLKAWIDHVVRKGLTLGFDGRGLVTGKKATVLIASGGIYTEGSPIQNRDIATHYLRLVLGVIGISDVTFVAGGGAKAVDLGEASMEGFVEKLGADIKRAASM
ncbi:FMN-dependent NADH-azoreductase [Massilia antarctica]|uniref:FMN-dependent NADH-azoreductase n=1 Tax=Massilia antarctica TaxID=2765360 RepID=UPI0006BB7759|nr:NAD(P)H-dependent oxidoreductase [Massilia sp. H27-R4]MCY0912751.1 NAD(P)H-dependent oxidoreductase [Massilia sp. H27-R4]CUI03821.1 FMN-dependent NADH-azoreductase [Janthinobacterium sp. CG23_2]CUU27607.1 FMN-dependent NADH-azoreductase [Janthinobacterium sp. CG23_2]